MTLIIRHKNKILPGVTEQLEVFYELRDHSKWNNGVLRGGDAIGAPPPGSVKSIVFRSQRVAQCFGVINVNS